MKRKIIAIVMASMMSVSLLAGCGKDTEKEASAKAEEGVAAEAVEANSEEMEFDESKANDVDYVMNYYQKVLDNSSRKGSSYALIYMDEDDIPELITDKGLFLSKDYEDEIDGSSVPIYYLPYGNRILEDESEGHSDYDVYHVFRRLDWADPFDTGNYHLSMGFSILAGNSNDITWNYESITNAQMMQLMDELRIDDMIQLTYSFDSSTPVSDAYESLLENPNGVANEVGEEEQQVMELDVDNTVYGLYRKYIEKILGTTAINEDRECFFADVDRDGTPELITCGESPCLWFIDSYGDVHCERTAGLIEGEGKFYRLDDGLEFLSLSDGELLIEYRVRDIFTGENFEEVFEYYHDDVLEEISAAEYEILSNTDVYTAVGDYTSYPSLLDAWEAYNN